MRPLMLGFALCLGLPMAGQAQTGEMFIPGEDDTPFPLVQQQPQPRNPIARCLLNATAANCNDLSNSGGGDIQFESAVIDMAPEYETLVFDPNAGTVQVTKAPPAVAPDYTAPPPEKTATARVPTQDHTAQQPGYQPPPKRVALPSISLTIEFDYDSDRVRGDQLQNINTLVAALSDPALAGTSYAVIGHTDSVGSDAYNCNLSQRRAQTVASFLQGSHVNVQLYPVGFGEQVLKNTVNPRAAENRRVTFMRLPDHPGPILQTAQQLCLY
ncbi:OmpA family protein [Pseudoponticoccus marisrubri]|uniref:OmpA-like domain-containing protein n=1 Tax=Pseudoponticoccus marisrubri TaxID=1685382 RepID=A0A0W7WFD1_9RHOB|nr:OmpA family protein [Pseudoponticoccus marisrubri]KUF09329.1 hypothetical protein AVJ23_17960 [Pseudoponticoccus marisrubri]